MAKKWLERTELLVQPQGLNKLQNAHVCVVGLGGIGSFAAEFIARAGIGKMTIVDGDTVDITNINRQLPALSSTVGQSKAGIMAARLLDIAPDLQLNTIEQFLEPEDTIKLIETIRPDYVIDCIDSLTPKINLITAAYRNRIRIISCLGAGGKLDASKVVVTDISKTVECPLAKNVRKRLKNIGISSGVKVVFSPETPIAESLKHTDGTKFKKSFYGTISYMPALFGLHAAGYVINHILESEKTV
jgi:tRNA A37 threonylcarbamoyladenosine dehydratase